MKINLKKVLLAGTAIVAVSAFAPVTAHAAAVAQTLGGATSWGVDGDQNQAPADGTGALFGDSVNLVTFTLTVENDATNDDGSGNVNTFALGAVTGTTGDMIIQTGAAADLTVTGTTVTLTGAGDITVQNQDAHNAVAAVTFSGAVSMGGNLVVLNNESSAAKAVSLTTAGLTVTGTTDVTSGTFAGAGTAALTTSGATTFTGLATVTAGANNASATATLTLGGSTTVTHAFAGGLVLDDNGVGLAKLTVSGSGTRSVTGTIDGDAAGEGTLTVSSTGTTTFSGAIGATQPLLAVTNSSTGSMVFSSTVAATNVKVTSTGSATFNGNVTGDFTFATAATSASAATLATTKNISGNIDNTVSAGKGSFTFAGTSTVGGTIGATNYLSAITLSNTTLVANVGKTVSVGGDTVTATTTTLKGNILDVTGTVATPGAANTIASTITSATTLGHIVSSGVATSNAATLVSLTVSPADYIADATEFMLIDGTGGAGIADLTAQTQITDDSFVLSFTQKTTDDDDFVLVAAREALAGAGVATTANNASVGAVLDVLADDGDDVLDDVMLALDDAASQGAVNDILASLNPDVSGGAVLAAHSVSNSTMNITSERLAMLRTGNDSSGIATGDASQGVSTWGQFFGQSASQDNRDSVNGYDSSTWGVTIGIDTKNWIDNGTIGFAFSYGDTDVDGKDINTTKTDVRSYQGTLYGSYTMANNVFFNGMAAFAHNRNDTTRHDVGGVIGTSAEGDFDAQQYTVRGEFGRDYTYDKTTLTPTLSANWMHYTPDSYTETGNGANLHVDGDSLNVFDLGLGLNASWMYQNPSGSYFQPSVHGGVKYDLVGDEVESTNTFTGGGGSFKTTGFDPQRTTFDVGVGAKYFSTQNWEFTANYDYELKSDYAAHAGYVRAAYKF